MFYAFTKILTWPILWHLATHSFFVLRRPSLLGGRPLLVASAVCFSSSYILRSPHIFRSKIRRVPPRAARWARWCPHASKRPKSLNTKEERMEDLNRRKRKDKQKESSNSSVCVVALPLASTSSQQMERLTGELPGLLRCSNSCWKLLEVPPRDFHAVRWNMFEHIHQQASNQHKSFPKKHARTRRKSLLASSEAVPPLG